jgi:hypothetical protein
MREVLKGSRQQWELGNLDIYIGSFLSRIRLEQGRSLKPLIIETPTARYSAGYGGHEDGII